MCGKSLYCGCFGMPQTESSDCCGCPPGMGPPHIPASAQRAANCPCKQSKGKSNCEQIICFIPAEANAHCQHQQHGHQRPICCRMKQQIQQQSQKQQHPPGMQCAGRMSQAPGCIPMTCEPMPNCPNKFICRPQVQGNMRCPRSNIQCKQAQAPQQRNQKPVAPPKNAEKPPKNPKPTMSSPKQCIVAEICPHNPKCSSSANKCDPNSSFEEFKKKK